MRHAGYHPPVVNCAYGYPKEIQEEAGKAEEDSAQEETGQEKAGEEEGACQKNSETKSRRQGYKLPEKSNGAQEKGAAQKRTLLSRDIQAGSFGPRLGWSIGRPAGTVPS